MTLDEYFELLKNAMLADAARMDALLESNTEADDEDDEPHPDNVAAANGVVMACTTPDAARMVLARLHELQTELEQVIPTYVGCLPVVDNVFATETTTDPHAYYRLLDARIEHALGLLTTDDHHACTLLRQLAGMRDKSIRSGLVYAVVAEGQPYFNRGGDEMPKANMDARVVIRRVADDAVLADFPRFTADNPFA